MGRCIVLTEGDHSLLQEMFRWYQRNKNLRHQFRRRSIFGGGGDTASAILAAGGRVYEVQDSAMGDGIYNCVKLQLESDNWTDETSKDKFYLDGLKIWKADYHYVVDDIVLYSDSYYGCVTDHTSEAGTPPPNDEFVKIWSWGYATGAWDSETAYVVGDRVIYGGKHYLCIHNNTNQIPDVRPSKWKETYVAGDYVYRTIDLTDHFFKCTTTHVSASNKQPPNTNYWESFFIAEVLNLQESDPTASTAQPLTEGDRMTVWKTKDDDGNNRYVGLPFQTGGFKVFEVQSEATGDGVYNCYEQTLDATDWNNTSGAPKIVEKNTVSIQVLNLAEYDPELNYVRHLTAGDLIAAFQYLDDEGANRWCGMPLRQYNSDRTRMAYCKNDAGTGKTITCFLDTDTVGTEITVHCSIARGGTNLNEAIPLLKDGDPIFVQKINDGTNDYWRCVGVPFMLKENCLCTPP